MAESLTLNSEGDANSTQTLIAQGETSLVISIGSFAIRAVPDLLNANPFLRR
jgi:hypothetical protein